MFKSKGTFLKVMLIHNLIFMDLLFLGCLIILWKQGVPPNTLLKYATIFYGGEGILGAGIKISKIIKDKTSKKGGNKDDKGQLETKTIE